MKKLTKKERKKMIRFCMESEKELNGVEEVKDEWSNLSDEDLNNEVEWFEYLWTK